MRVQISAAVPVAVFRLFLRHDIDQSFIESRYGWRAWDNVEFEDSPRRGTWWRRRRRCGWWSRSTCCRCARWLRRAWTVSPRPFLNWVATGWFGLTGGDAHTTARSEGTIMNWQCDCESHVSLFTASFFFIVVWQCVIMNSKIDGRLCRPNDNRTHDNRT